MTVVCASLGERERRALNSPVHSFRGRQSHFSDVRWSCRVREGSRGPSRRWRVACSSLPCPEPGRGTRALLCSSLTSARTYCSAVHVSVQETGAKELLTAALHTAGLGLLSSSLPFPCQKTERGAGNAPARGARRRPFAFCRSSSARPH